MKRTAIALVVALSAWSSPAAAQECGTPSATAILDANNVKAELVNDGTLVAKSRLAYEVPKGSGVQNLYTAGIWVAGKRDTSIAGAFTNFGSKKNYWPGPLDGDGLPQQDCQEFDRIWLVDAQDLATFDLTGSAAVDLDEWPTGLGAPTLDANGQLITFDSANIAERVGRPIDLTSGERPALLGDQMAWWIINDRGGPRSNATDAAPIGIEIQVAAHSVSGTGPVGFTTFYEYSLVNRDTNNLDSAYVGLMVDADTGDPQDDYMGSDTLRQMVFSYNADNDDEGTSNVPGYGIAPPAIGVTFFTSPAGLSQTIPMWGSHYWPDGPPKTGKDYYNRLQGRWNDGTKLARGGDGHNETGTKTNYIFPETPGDFWSEMDIGDGAAMAGSDRSLLMSSGPFNLGAGQTTKLSFGIVWSRSTDYLASVSQLKEDVDQVRQIWMDVFRVSTESTHQSEVVQLRANYPNPFAGRTTITFSLARTNSVALKIFDATGRLVRTLRDGVLSAGEYHVEFDAGDLANGLYLARLTTGDMAANRILIRVN